LQGLLPLCRHPAGVAKAQNRAWSNGKGEEGLQSKVWSQSASRKELCEAQNSIVETRRQITQECMALTQGASMVKARMLNEICEMISKSLTHLGHAAYSLSQLSDSRTV
jgi:hypothetical protein